jgi:hypothetical protein
VVTATVGQADATVRRQISKMLELNDGQVHQFDRARLIDMLDEEIAKRNILRCAQTNISMLRRKNRCLDRITVI